jgi:signal-transduction protein with cAMP-binding, CBS, and nucleotidyltransferase domain
MEHEITTIPLVSVKSRITCDTPNHEDIIITENDPAITVMTDFTETTPVIIEADANLNAALQKMKAQSIRLLLVSGEQNHIIGVITAYDIQSEKPVQYGADNKIAVSEIQTAMLMTPLEQTPAFDFAFVKQALVRHVIHTMKELERPHTLVIETQDEQRIRGVFSTSRISKLLGRAVYQPLHAAHSLADIQQEIGSH